MSTEDTTTQAFDTATADMVTERCGQCGWPAAHDQRYCLNCGFHRRNAPDPVARYLSEASVARTLVAQATTLAAGRRRLPRIGLRLAAVLMVVTLLVGIAIGNATGTRTAAPRVTATHHVTHKHSAQVKNTTGSSYLQQEQNLPSTVTP